MYIKCLNTQASMYSNIISITSSFKKTPKCPAPQKTLPKCPNKEKCIHDLRRCFVATRTVDPPSPPDGSTPTAEVPHIQFGTQTCIYLHIYMCTYEYPSCVFFHPDTKVVRRCLLQDVHFSSTKFWKITPQVARQGSTQTLPLTNNVVTHSHFKWRWNMINFTYSNFLQWCEEVSHWKHLKQCRLFFSYKK